MSSEILIERREHDDEIGAFIGDAFEAYAADNDVLCDYEDFCFVAKDGETILGAVTGQAY